MIRAFVISLLLHLLFLWGGALPFGLHHTVKPSSLEPLQIQLSASQKSELPRLTMSQASPRDTKKVVVQQAPVFVPVTRSQVNTSNKALPVNQEITTRTRPNETENGVLPDIHLAILAYRLQLAITLKQQGLALLTEAKTQGIEAWEIAVLHVPGQVPKFSFNGLPDPKLNSNAMRVMQTLTLPNHLLHIPFSFTVRVS